MSRISVGGWEKGLEIDSGILKNGLKWQSLLYVFWNNKKQNKN